MMSEETMSVQYVLSRCKEGQKLWHCARMLSAVDAWVNRYKGRPCSIHRCSAAFADSQLLSLFCLKKAWRKTRDLRVVTRHYKSIQPKIWGSKIFYKADFRYTFTFASFDWRSSTNERSLSTAQSKADHDYNWRYIILAQPFRCHTRGYIRRHRLYWWFWHNDSVPILRSYHVHVTP